MIYGIRIILALRNWTESIFKCTKPVDLNKESSIRELVEQVKKKSFTETIITTNGDKKHQRVASRLFPRLSFREYSVKPNWKLHIHFVVIIFELVINKPDLQLTQINAEGYK